jgi:hypothetical protein
VAGDDLVETVDAGTTTGQLVTEFANIGTENASSVGDLLADEVVDLTSGKGDGRIGGHGIRL